MALAAVSRGLGAADGATTVVGFVWAGKGDENFRWPGATENLGGDGGGMREGSLDTVDGFVGVTKGFGLVEGNENGTIGERCTSGFASDLLSGLAVTAAFGSYAWLIVYIRRHSTLTSLRLSGAGTEGISCANSSSSSNTTSREPFCLG